MQFTTKLAGLAAVAAAAVSAHNVKFVNQDGTTRSIIFTGTSAISTLTISGNSNASVTLPSGWQGNWYSVSEGAEDVPGMLGEVALDAWDGISYFDVSAIVNPNDKDGVKLLYPASQDGVNPKTCYSGCEVFPCNTAYYAPDDVQTVSTSDTDFICTLGGSTATSKRDETPLVERKFVLGEF
ncbi:hypothetical protein BX600DRAFT_436837 [Xylariales sp. PMI_506]|nr:hypothetical protein BX600DRAFT_436837 [Xylariales sp. PMI_506]